MIIKVTEAIFIEAFRSIRPDGFSYEGLKALFNYLDDLDEQCETKIELDVIAHCCEYAESPIKEALRYYNLKSLEELRDETTVIDVDDNTIIYQSY